MTAIVYFGEMLVASVLAIVLLAISRLPMSSGTVLFGGGVIGWTLGEYCIMPNPTPRSSQFCKYGFVSRWSI
jgi:hypothetical protein